jgi:dTDP-4-amino-4,6-dideoxygalactose transaminase
VSERYYSRAVSIPLFPALTEDQQDRIVNILAGALA